MFLHGQGYCFQTPPRFAVAKLPLELGWDHNNPTTNF